MNLIILKSLKEQPKLSKRKKLSTETKNQKV